MNWKKHLAEAATLIVAAILCAVVSNALAGRERKVAFVGTYPNALKVPQEAPPPAPIVTPTTTSQAPVPATTTATTTTIAPVVTPSPRNPATPQPAAQPIAQPRDLA